MVSDYSRWVGGNIACLRVGLLLIAFVFFVGFIVCISFLFGILQLGMHIYVLHALNTPS